MIISEEARRAERVLFRSRPMGDADAILRREERADNVFHICLLAAFLAVVALAVVEGMVR